MSKASRQVHVKLIFSTIFKNDSVKTFAAHTLLNFRVLELEHPLRCDSVAFLRGHRPLTNNPQRDIRRQNRSGNSEWKCAQ